MQSVFGQSQMQGLNVNSEMPIPSVQGILNHSTLMMMTKVRQGVHFEIAVSVAKKMSSLRLTKIRYFRIT
jgi:hypothetical protein